MSEIDNFLKYQTAIDENWERLSWVEEIEGKYYHEPNTKISESFCRDEIAEWCSTRCKGDWVIAGGTVLLKDSRDAMLFKLTFIDSYAKVK